MDSLLFDPILRGPLAACGLLGFLCGLVGVILIFRRQSLVGETLAHACYPGLVVGALFSKWFFGEQSLLWTVVGASVSCFLAAKAVAYLQERRRVYADAALSCVLSSSFALGLLLISAAQSVYPTLWRQLQMVLVGQAPTIRDEHVCVVLSFVVIGSLVLMVFRRSLRVSLFDEEFARFSLMTNRWVEWLILFLIVATIIGTLRTMGVVLMTALLIFPAVSARLLTSKFERVFIGAGLIGGVCGYSGVLLSYQCAAVSESAIGRSVWIPTGPLIALLLVGCFSLVLLFSPREGLLVRAWRRRVFVRRCQLENVLKFLWKECSQKEQEPLSVVRLAEVSSMPLITVRSLVRTLIRKGFLNLLEGGVIEMTASGMAAGRKLVRLHRLWELYLVECCGVPKERVHPSAEGMEHILTPQIEERLSVLLKNPAFDPHLQPIPEV